VNLVLAKGTVGIEIHVFEALKTFLESGNVPKDDFGKPIYRNKSDLTTKAVQDLLRKHRKQEANQK